ncbi:MAG: mannitol dehydrogenase family protein [Clostridiales bacterium]|nr:mannitol dehydrogenase family protein [Clostridiales bacterium]
MLSLSMRRDSLKNTGEWSERNIILPSFSIDEVRAKSEKEPTWLHFGAGNIFRGFIARLSQDLLNQGLIDTGIIAADTFDYEIIDRIYRPYDDLTLMVDLRPDGSTGYEIIGSVTESRKADPNDAPEMSRLYEIASSPSLQIISFTITEKGYALYDMHGKLLPVVSSDMENGPKSARHAMSIVCALLWERFQKGGAPLALASMDNCSSNGKKLQSSILEVAEAWEKRGFVSSGFIDYLNDTGKVSFPWSMIDKITPRPDASVEKMIEELGISDMRPFTTAKGTFIAPFVNAEVPQYLVIEDTFPNGRPPLEKAGVFMTDRDTVNKAERMKVTTCLNPLHTALAVFGCVLGYTRISDEMKDPELVSLITKIGYSEGLPVVTDPVILKPSEFIREVIEERLPNPFIPDAPQRIATDTSLKVPIRFGETIKSYISDPSLDVTSLTYIPLAIAGWIRYLLGIDDNGDPIELSSDPLLPSLKEQLSAIRFSDPDSVKGNLDGLLSNSSVFGSDLVSCGLSPKIESFVSEMIEGPGAVRKTLKKHLG